MKNKYGLIKNCLYCSSEFITKPRFNNYCSVKCKNPLNRGEYDPWNKGIKLTEEQKAKQNTEGLKKGREYWKGKKNVGQKERMLGEANPNWNGGVNKIRKEKGSLSRPGQLNGMFGKNHTTSAIEKMRQAKLQNYKDGIYKSKSAGECQLAEELQKKFPDLVWQYTIPNYHRIYDMYIPSLNLIVEYDGDYWHREEKYLSKDRKDTAKAIKQGFKIFRYWESIVKQKGIDNIVEDIVKLEGKYCRILKEELL